MTQSKPTASKRERMFTGIIQKLGRVTRAEPSTQALQVSIETGYPDLFLGESIAVDGACLTVAESDSQGTAQFFISSETLSRTSLGRLAVDTTVNLERAVSVGQSL